MENISANLLTIDENMNIEEIISYINDLFNKNNSIILQAEGYVTLISLLIIFLNVLE